MNELDKLEAYLKEKCIKYERIDKSRYSDLPKEMMVGNVQGFGEQHQIIVYDSKGKIVWDAICHWGSYGWKEGLLEIMGNIVDEKRVGDRVEGWLTAQDVIDRIEGRV